MDDFDMFNQSTAVQNTTVDNDNLFESEIANTTTTSTSFDSSFNGPSQKPFQSDNNLNAGDNFALDDFTSTSQVSSNSAAGIADQPYTDLTSSSSVNVLTAITNTADSDDAAGGQSSFDIFSKPVATPKNANASGDIFTTGISSQENLSVLEAFNKRRQQEIAEKDTVEKKKIDELRQQAKADLERWYRDRLAIMERNRQSIRSAEDELRIVSLQKSDKNSCDWAKVIRFLELSQGTQLSKAKRDLTRMKTTILNVKRSTDGKTLPVR